MADHIAQNDAVAIQQVTVLTPTADNAKVYDVLINGKLPNSASYTSDASGTAQEIVEGLQALLAALTSPPEFLEMVWSENDTTLIATGLATGKPFTIAEGPGNGNWASITTSITAKSKNHWIAENFNSGSLPANGDNVTITGLTSDQSFKWGLDQSAVLLASLDIRADSQAEIGLDPINSDSTAYGEYRDLFLKIGASVLKIGDGEGQGSSRIQIDLGATTCAATVFKTGTANNRAAVHLLGGDGSSTLQVLGGTVDLAMRATTTGSWSVIVVSGGTVRCGTGVTLVTVEAAGTGTVETRSGATTLRTRQNGTIIHIGSGNVTTVDIQGGPVKIKATGALTLGTVNGYAGKTLDLSECDSLVTVTNMNSYGTPSAPFTINDPNNKLVMTNACSTPNGAQSLVLITGSGKNVRLT